MKSSKITGAKKIIIILGQPGSGKGTQAELLSEKFGFFHFETSKVIEENFNKAKKGDFVKIDGKKYFLSEEKKIRSSGKVMSPPLINYWVQKSIKELARQGKSIIISGSPRTLYEAERLFPLLEKIFGKENITIIEMEQGPNASIFRNSHRRICELRRHSILYSRETAKLTVCPIDGSKLVSRGKLDDPKVIKERLIEYKERTLPIVTFAKKHGFSVKKIDGEKSVADVFNNILKHLK